MRSTSSLPTHQARRDRSWPLALYVLLLLLAFPRLGWAQSFSMRDLRVEGKVLTVITQDLNADHRPDLLVISKRGASPNETRWASLFWQQADGSFHPRPDLVWEMDPEATVVDVGPIGPRPDEKAIVYLTGSEVRAYRIKDRTPPTSTTLLKLPTFTVFPERADLPTWPLVREWKGGDRPWLAVPQFGQLLFYPLGQDGPLQPGEAIALQQPTFLFTGDDTTRLVRDFSLQMVYRFPQLLVQDFDGDHRPDLIATWQEDVAVYLQDPMGRFPVQPSKTFHFDLRTAAEKSLRSVQVSSFIEDLDHDGSADLILTKLTGRVTDRRIVTQVYLNRGGNLASTPDAQIQHEGFGTTILVKDLNRDGKRDLVFPFVKIGVSNLVRNLLSNRVEVSLFAHLFQGQPAYRAAADWTRTFGYQVDMSDGIMLEGAWPNLEGDFDGDGEPDLLVAGDGEIRVYLASRAELFAREPAALVKVKTSPHLVVNDLNRDGLADILLWYDREPELSGVIKVLMNTARARKAR
jgi:hypothetical protein